MILIIDNYDSFTNNVAQALMKLKADAQVARNDKIDLDQIARSAPSHIVISPGPKRPEEAGISIDLIRRFEGSIPILGICLGHQAMAAAFGGKIVRSKWLAHGKVAKIYHDRTRIYDRIDDPMLATKYHSLIVDEATLPDRFIVSARDEHGQIMGIRSKSGALEGVQFHPESIMTKDGERLLANFIQQSS